MPFSTQDLVVTLQTIYWSQNPLQVTGALQPRLWPVYFKIDCTTAFVDDDGRLTGTATVSDIKGDGSIGADLNYLGSVAIPLDIGQWRDQLVPILLPAVLGGGNVGAVFGVAFLLFQPHRLEADALEAGHAELTVAVQEALNEAIASLKPFQTEPDQPEIDKLKREVEAKVRNAIEDQLTFWEKLYESMTWTADVLVHHSQDDLQPGVLDQLDIVAESAAGLYGAVGLTGAASQQRRDTGQGTLSHFGSQIKAVAGFADPSFEHALAATDDGTVTELWWQGSGAPGQGTIGQFGSPITALAGFYSADGFDHAIVATQDHEVTELWWQGPNPPGRGTLYTYRSPVVALAAYYSGDGYSNVIAATADRTVSQLWWQGGGQVGQGTLADNFLADVVGVAGFFGADLTHHVIVLTADGAIADLTWQGGAAPATALVGQVPVHPWSKPVGVGAYDSPADGEQHVVVAMSDGMLREFHWAPARPDAVSHDDLANVRGLSSAGAFTDGSGYQQVIAGTTTGDLQQVWWPDH